jgi:hypothetical protein
MSGARRYDVLFSTDKFNLSEPREYFINDCCYGDDVARWLVERLRLIGLSVTEPDQEDWGWYFDAQYQQASYFVGVGGTPDDESSGNSYGQWRLCVEKHRTLLEKLTGANQLSEDNSFIEVLKAMVSGEPGLVLIGVE